jgi:DNA sulfur modification protein DndD
MMDTPFGRLDEHHGPKILQFVPQLAEQVFLLVHGREVTEDDLVPVAASIVERYELRRDDVDRTSIVVRSAL